MHNSIFVKWQILFHVICNNTVFIATSNSTNDSQINTLPQVVAVAPEVTEPEEPEIKKEIPVSPYKPVNKVQHQKKEYSVIRIKGLQISFDASLEGMDVTISKVLKALQ